MERSGIRMCEWLIMRGRDGDGQDFVRAWPGVLYDGEPEEWGLEEDEGRRRKKVKTG